MVNAHRYKINWCGKICSRLYITGKAVIGYDPDSKKFEFLSNSPEILAEGEQAKSGVLENAQYIDSKQLDDDLVGEILKGLKSEKIRKFQHECNCLVMLAEEK